MGDVQERPDQYGQGFPNNEALYINQIKALEETVKKLHDEKKGLIKRSEHITRFMAKNAQGMKGLENLNDPHSNTKLAERFERIFLDLWTEVLIHEQQKTELQLIKWLSSLMKVARRMGVHRNTINNLLTKYRTIGNVANLPRRGPTDYFSSARPVYDRGDKFLVREVRAMSKNFARTLRTKRSTS